VLSPVLSSRFRQRRQRVDPVRVEEVST